MAILGYSTQGAALVSLGTGRMQVSRFTLAGPGTLTELHGWFVRGASTVRLVIYRHATGPQPYGTAALVAYTTPISLAGSGNVELSQAGFSVPLPAGDYWIGARSDVAGGLHLGTIQGLGYSGVDSGAPDPPSDPFPSVNTASGTTQLSCWAVVGPPAPAADFTAAPTAGTAPLSVTFTDTSTNTPSSWAWNFGDSATSTAQNPTHVYAAAGTYTVTLTTTNVGGSSTKTRTDVVAVSPAAPVANFTGAPLTGLAPLAVSFTDLSTNMP